MTRYSEPEFVVPALEFIRANPGVTTTAVIHHLEDVFDPTGHDARLLDGRNDSHFSQKVRNLKSHNKLGNLGLVTYHKIGRNGHWWITNEGVAYLTQHPRR